MSSLVQNLVCSSSGGLMTFIAPIMNWINFTSIGTWLLIQTIFWLAIFLPIYKHDPFILNSKDKGKTKDPGVAFGFSFLIYYVAGMIITFVLRQAFCAL